MFKEPEHTTVHPLRCIWISNNFYCFKIDVILQALTHEHTGGATRRCVACTVQKCTFVMNRSHEITAATPLLNSCNVDEK